MLAGCPRPPVFPWEMPQNTVWEALGGVWRGLGNSPFGSSRVPRHWDLRAAGAEEMGKATGKFYNWEKRNVQRRGSGVWLWGPRETGAWGAGKTPKRKWQEASSIFENLPQRLALLPLQF